MVHEQSSFKLESIDEYIPDELKSETTALGYLQLLPGVHGTDGFLLQDSEGNRSMTDIKSMTLTELKELMTELGEKPFRAKQIYSWLHEHLAASWEEMTNLPKSLKQKLEAYPITALETVDVQISKTDGTRKYLFRLSDGNMIESVLMKYKYGNSVCISSQAGCRMGCRFCASTIGGLARNLLPSEMLDQIYRIQASIGERVSNVVVMGSGEPLDNYDNLLRFIHILTEEGGLHLSQRNLTVSTCGLVPKMYELAEEKLQMTLAVSLHAPNDEKRQELMPIAQNTVWMSFWRHAGIILIKQDGELHLNTAW